MLFLKSSRTVLLSLVILTPVSFLQAQPLPVAAPLPAPASESVLERTPPDPELAPMKERMIQLQVKAKQIEGTADQMSREMANLKSEMALLREASKGKSEDWLSHSIATSIMWTLLCGFMVMFMQAGFALVESGFTREKNAAHTMAMNFMVYSLGMLSFWACGFAIMFGGTGSPQSVSTVATLGPDVPQHLNQMIGWSWGDQFFGLMGNSGYFLPVTSGGIFALFLFQMVFMDTAATIPTGSMAERWKFLPFCLFAFCVGGFVYPIYGSWVWGGGWLAALGTNHGLGHGHVDFAGSSVVHLCGGTLALVGAIILGPRLGKFNKDGTANPIPGHNLPMAFLGTFILAFGWFGFNAGSTLNGMDTQIGVIATNTMLATASGAAVAMILTWMKFTRPDPSFMCNGLLAGAVSITAPCAFVDSWAAVLIGAIAGAVVLFSAIFVEEVLKVDDPVGAISVHGSCGAWGVISLGLFANGKYGAGWNSVGATDYLGKAGQGVTGLFYGDASQLLAQLTGTAACVVAVGLMGYIMFSAIEILVGNRVDPADEIAGIDIPEVGTIAYPRESGRRTH